MKTNIPDFSQLRILVVGDVMLDRYWHGDASRISPEAPVPVVKIGQCEDRPGGAANVALNICALGAHAVIMGVVGDDAVAVVLKQKLEAAGVAHHLVALDNMPTITKLRVLSHHQQLLRMDFEESYHQCASNLLLEYFKTTLSDDIDAVIFSDYDKGTLVDIAAMIDLARKKSIPVFVDPKQTDMNLYCGATVFKPNLQEFYTIVGRCDDEKMLINKAYRLLETYEIDALLLTRGEHGITLLRQNEPEFHLPARAKEVFDVTGAGDTVIAVLTAAVAGGLPLHEATRLANIAASIAVNRLGAATVSVPELKNALKSKDSDSHGEMTEEQLLIAVREARAKGKKIVMTNGCFDLLHAGHVHYLEQAKKYGDRLIVAVNADDSVRQLKGDGRPLNTLEKRMAVLSGLSAVDWVVSFSELTPERLISTVLPDVLVKGGDYKGQVIAGGDAVLKNGGRVELLDFVAGCSTSDLIKKMKVERK